MGASWTSFPQLLTRAHVPESGTRFPAGFPAPCLESSETKTPSLARTSTRGWGGGARGGVGTPRGGMSWDDVGSAPRRGGQRGKPWRDSVMRTWAQFFSNLEGPSMFVSLLTSQAKSMAKSLISENFGLSLLLTPSEGWGVGVGGCCTERNYKISF